MQNKEEYKKEFLSFINLLFYSAYEESGYNSFIIDFTNNETKQYFFKACVSWMKLTYNIDITKDEIVNLYIKYSQYNVFNGVDDDIIDKFVITKEIMENMMENGIIPKVEYVMENSTVKKLDPNNYIKKKK